MPRAFRAAGFKTDVCNAEDIARVRMYASAAAVVQGLLKNATEGIANNRLIGLFTVLLAGGSVLPILSLPHAIQHGWNSIAVALLALATLLSFLPRALIALRLGQSWLGVMLQPLAVAVFLGIQWWAFLRAKLGREAVAWRGRSA